MAKMLVKLDLIRQYFKYGSYTLLRLFIMFKCKQTNNQTNKKNKINYTWKDKWVLKVCVCVCVCGGGGPSSSIGNWKKCDHWCTHKLAVARIQTHHGYRGITGTKRGNARPTTDQRRHREFVLRLILNQCIKIKKITCVHFLLGYYISLYFRNYFRGYFSQTK